MKSTTGLRLKFGGACGDRFHRATSHMPRLCRNATVVCLLVSVTLIVRDAEFGNDDSGQFVQYNVVVEQNGQELSHVGRRFRDFKTFDDSWRKLYPNIQIKLPRSVLVGKTSSKVVSERVISLTDYLRSVAEVRSIRPLLASFLGVTPSTINDLMPKFQQRAPVGSGAGAPRPRPSSAAASVSSPSPSASNSAPRNGAATSPGFGAAPSPGAGRGAAGGGGGAGAPCRKCGTASNGMPFCSNCGERHEPDLRGLGPTPQIKEKCGNCGIDASGKFCQGCGYKLANTAASRSSTASSSGSNGSSGSGRSGGPPSSLSRPGSVSSFSSSSSTRSASRSVGSAAGRFGAGGAGRGGPISGRGGPIGGRPAFGGNGAIGGGRGGFGGTSNGPPVPTKPGNLSAPNSPQLRNRGFGGATRTPPLPGPKPNLVNYGRETNQSAPPLPSGAKPQPFGGGRPPRSSRPGSDIVIVGNGFINDEYVVAPSEFRGDIYNGRKRRRRKSFTVASTKDYLQIADNVMVTRQFKTNGDHHCIFSDTALVYDPRFKSSKRVLILSDMSIYLLSPGTLTSKLRMPITDVRTVSLSTQPDHFLVISSKSGKPDQMIMCPRKTEFLVALRFRMQRSNQRIDLNFSDDLSVTLKPGMVSVVMFRNKPNSYDESVNLQVMNRGAVPGASISVAVPENLLADPNRDSGGQARAIQIAEEEKARSSPKSSSNSVSSAIGGFVRGVHARVNSLSRGSSPMSAPPMNAPVSPRSSGPPGGYGQSNGSGPGRGASPLSTQSSFSGRSTPSVSSFSVSNGGNPSGGFSSNGISDSASDTSSNAGDRPPATGNAFRDLYRGEKPHRRTSLQMDYKQYYLAAQIRQNLTDMIMGNDPGEKMILFGDTVFKINRRDQKQKRILLLSNSAVYILQTASLAIARRIALSTIERISVSKRGDHWMVLHVFAQHDVVIMCPRKTEFLLAATKAQPKIQIRCTNRIQYDLKTRDIKFIRFGDFGGKFGDFEYGTNPQNKSEILVSFQFAGSALASEADLQNMKPN